MERDPCLGFRERRTTLGDNFGGMSTMRSRRSVISSFGQTQKQRVRIPMLQRRREKLLL
ncbi:hypothetical protein Ahy_B10g103599 isoform B [Arachis hypogaea]|uniref:Uncharacterized protein n=1 Tax=Arachis hypogaea TaxID=3818 RepID=A0A444X3W7_ARAHY|nr:hypothetical protein Ahy_B10g103599 isoform B [Arachis hypogaea]